MTTAVEPVPIPAPCTKCGGISFETVESPLQCRRPLPPKFVRPCIPAARKSVPHRAGWLHEPKFDGYRLQVVKEGRLVRLYSKGGYDWTKRLARLADALTGLPSRSAVIDAEPAFPGASGVPDFEACGLPSASAGKTSSQCLPSTSCTATVPI